MEYLKEKFRTNPEAIFIGSILASLLFFNFLAVNNIAFLYFFYLPIVAVGFFMGKRMAVLFAFFTVLMVWFIVLVDKERFVAMYSEYDLNIHFVLWGGFLILAGWVGSLSENLRAELRLSNKLQGQLAVEKELLEERVSDRTRALVKAHQKLKLLANTDPLTKLLNRRGMAEKLNYEKIRHGRNKKPFSILLCDIDHFKKVNDTYGHSAGDYVLKEIAKILNEVSRKSDVFCRWGGEEFLALAPETDQIGGALLAEKLRTSVEETIFEFENHKISVTLSFGLSEYTENHTIDSCIKIADRCLYLAKESGRNQMVPKISDLSPHLTHRPVA